MKETMLTNILEEEKIFKNIISNFETKNYLLIKELIKIDEETYKKLLED